MKDSLKQALLLTACGTVGILLAACGDTKEEIQNEDSREDAQEALIRAGVIKSVLDPADEVGRQALFRAIEQGNEKIAKQLIIAGADVESPGPLDMTPLMLAILGNHDDMVRMFIRHGANVNVKAKEGITPLMLAALSGRKEMVQILLKEGAQVDAQDINGWTALMAACRKSDLISKAGSVLSTGFSHGKINCETIPAQACTPKQKREIVELLIMARADVNRESKDGWSPLTIAAVEGRPQMVRQLLDAGAKCEGASDLTPLMAAAFRGDKKTVNMLLKAKADVNRVSATNKKTPLMYAASKGHAEIVELLIAAGADINHREKEEEIHLSYTALSEAAAGGHEDVVKLLLEHGAASSADTSLLSNAVQKENLHIVQLLLQAGVDPNGGEPLDNASESERPLDMAVRALRFKNRDAETNLRIIELLVHSGALLSKPADAEDTYSSSIAATIINDTHLSAAQKERTLQLLTSHAENACRVLGEDPLSDILDITAPNTRAEHVKMALRAGASPNASKKKREPAIFRALTYRCEAEALAMLEGDINLAMTNDNDYTLLSTAIYYGCADVVEKLLSKGVNPNLLDGRDQPMLYIAIELSRFSSNEEDKRRAIIKALLAAGADPRKTSKYGEPYMHMAVSHHTDIELIRLLMDYGLNINEIHLSRTPLDHVYNKKWAAQLRTLGAKKYEELTK